MTLIKAIKQGHPGSLFSAFLYFDISFMVWVLLGPLALYVTQDLALTSTQKGLMVAFPLLGGAMLRLPAGFLTDYLGPKRTGVIGLLLTTIPLLWGWLFAGSFSQVLAMGLLLGVAGASFAVALPLASRWYPPESQGMALGIAGAGNSGTVFTALAAPRLAGLWGWHAVFGLALVPVLMTLAAFLFFAKDSPHQPEPKQFRSYLQILKTSDCWWFNFFYAVTFGGFVGLASYLPIFFHDQYQLSKIMAGNLMALCVFAGSFCRPIGGYISDRFGGVKVLSVLFMTVTVLMAGIGMLPSLKWAIFFLFFTLLCLGMGNGSVFQIIPQRFKAEIGMITGIVGAAGGMGGFFLPTLFGFLKDMTGSFGNGFFVFGAVLFSGFLSLVLIYQRSWKRRKWLIGASRSQGLTASGRVSMDVVWGG
ncbi:MAG: NarK/NasA family nitrate transporter [Nitrospirae bacterium]|nr:NarK/NasA family nitrate transporter [Nitrospirota bacterium]